MPEELLVRDHYSNIVEAEVRFKVNRELDRMEEDLLKKEVLAMLIRVGSVLYAGQLKKERELYDLDEGEGRLREDEVQLNRIER